MHDEEILSALRLWALWDLDLPLAEWHKEIVQWRLGTMQTANRHRVTALPSHYAASIFRQDTSSPGRTFRTSPPWATVMLATLFEYIVRSYGRERLSVLLDGLGRYRDWPTLSLAVFDTSSSQLATEWYEYLVAQYGAPDVPGENR